MFEIVKIFVGNVMNIKIQSLPSLPPINLRSNKVIERKKMNIKYTNFSKKINIVL